MYPEPGFITVAIEDTSRAEEALLQSKLITGMEVSDGEFRKEGLRELRVINIQRASEILKKASINIYGFDRSQQRLQCYAKCVTRTEM